MAPPARPPALVARGLLSLLAPPRCLGCREVVDGNPGHGRHEPLVCARCRARLETGSAVVPGVPGVEEALAATRYLGPARAVVAALKSGHAPAAAALAAELIAAALGSLPPGRTIVPVGPARLRRTLRGLDPAEEIAVALSARVGLAVERPLRRLDRRRQRGRPRERRLSDPPRFRVAGHAPRGVLLVDDVLTTGGTLAGCAAALRVAGSERISAVTFARTPAWVRMP